MRSALESVARRYRVSMGALEPIFVAAEAAGRDLRLDPLLIVAVIAVESRFNPFSESVMGAQGLMQVMPRFHQDKLPDGADELSFFDPVLNVRIGARILKESIRRNGGVVPGLQQFAGAADDAEQRYSAKVLQEKARLEASVKRAPMREA
jgi:soluble lytic murein transglycosylase-like protein